MCVVCVCVRARACVIDRVATCTTTPQAVGKPVSPGTSEDTESSKEASNAAGSVYDVANKSHYRSLLKEHKNVRTHLFVA